MTGPNIKHRLRAQLDRLFDLSGLLRWYERRMRQGLTILTYHRVLPLPQCIDYPLQALAMPVEAFRRQMQWLADHCRVLPVFDALAVLNEGGNFAKPLVAVTFDDGYGDNYTFAAPILEAHGLRGTFYVTSGFVDTGGPQWYDRASAAWGHLSAPHAQRLMSLMQRTIPANTAAGTNGQSGGAWMEGLKSATPDVRQELVALVERLANHPLEKTHFQPMRPEHVSELHARGHEIGSHTVSHPILPQLTASALANELQQSAARLGRWTGAVIHGFCYPNGDFDADVERAVIAAGYCYACTTGEGFNRPGQNPFRLLRLPMTMRRTMCGSQFELMGFRAELCRARSLLRRDAQDCAS